MTDFVKGHKFDRATFISERGIEELNAWLPSWRKTSGRCLAKIAFTKTDGISAQEVVSVIPITDTSQDETSMVEIGKMVAD